MTAQETPAATAKPPRRFRKRSFRRLPKPALPVKALWELATETEKARAHQTCAVMLEYWLGKTTKAQVAERLQVPPLRVWQLSQQALSGMVAGLLKQPRRKKGALMPTDPQDDPKLLKRRIAQLERELKLAQDVIELLRDLPAHRATKDPPGKSSPKAGGKKKPKPSKRAMGKKRRTPTTRRPSPQDGGSMAPGAGTDPEG
jgi:hypothetical protein